MKRFIQILLGVISLLGIIIILISAIDMIDEGSDDGLLPILLFVLPTIFTGYLFVKILKDDKYYEKIKLAFGVFRYGLLITIVINVILSFYYAATNVLGNKWPIAIYLFVVIGFLLTTLASFITWLVLVLRKKK